MRSIALSAIILTLVILCLYSCKRDKGLLPPPVMTKCDSVKYSTDIQPLFNTYCISCHSPGNLQAGLDLTNYATASVEAADIKARVYVSKDMPQAGNPMPTDAEREKIKCWVDKGAPND